MKYEYTGGLIGLLLIITGSLQALFPSGEYNGFQLLMLQASGWIILMLSGIRNALRDFEHKTTEGGSQ